MKDMEVILRGFAMLIDGENYAPSMVKFLNRFSRKCENNSEDQNQYLEGLFVSFLGAASTRSRSGCCPDRGSRPTSRSPCAPRLKRGPVRSRRLEPAGDERLR